MGFYFGAAWNSMRVFEVCQRQNTFKARKCITLDLTAAFVCSPAMSSRRFSDGYFAKVMRVFWCSTRKWMLFGSKGEGKISRVWVFLVWALNTLVFSILMPQKERVLTYKLEKTEGVTCALSSLLNTRCLILLIPNFSDYYQFAQCKT